MKKSLLDKIKITGIVFTVIAVVTTAFLKGMDFGKSISEATFDLISCISITTIILSLVFAATLYIMYRQEESKQKKE